MAKNWWEQRTIPKLHRGQREELPLHVPTPTSPGPHKLPFRPGNQGGDDWRTIQNIQERGGAQAIVELMCCSCGVKHHAMVFRALFDPAIKWLCEDCLDSGFRWGSTIPRDEMPRYQIVKSFSDDTLVRKLEKSANPRDPEHKPIDASERADRLERKKLRLEDLDK